MYVTSCDNTTCSEFDKEKEVIVREVNKILYLPSGIQCAVCSFSLRIQKVDKPTIKDQSIHVQVRNVPGDDFGNGYAAGLEEGLRRRR